MKRIFDFISCLYIFKVYFWAKTTSAVNSCFLPSLSFHIFKTIWLVIQTVTTNVKSIFGSFGHLCWLLQCGQMWTELIWNLPLFTCVCSQFILQCTMGKLKNRIKSSQLWQLISPWILTQKFPSFAHSFLNSPQTKINTNI